MTRVQFEEIPFHVLGSSADFMYEVSKDFSSWSFMRSAHQLVYLCSTLKF